MNGRERFLRACQCQTVDVPPIWLMRQAGRALPEYRALKERHSFLELVRTPPLAAEVTLQPVRRFGFDAAILFSDILVVPEALGQAYQFRESGGMAMAFAVRTAAEAAGLAWGGMAGRLEYVADTLTRLKTTLAGQTALLGFAGSPWTLANFMIEGGSVPEFTRARDWWESDRAGFDAFLSRLTGAVIEYLRLQIQAGADAVQIFDSLSGVVTQIASGRRDAEVPVCWADCVAPHPEDRAPVDRRRDAVLPKHLCVEQRLFRRHR